MNYQWMDEYLLCKIGSSKDYKEEWDAVRYLIGGKMFALKGDDKFKKSIITLKCHPDLSISLREKYEHIISGYYMNKEHWNSVYLDGDVPIEVLKELIDISYDLVLKSLTKKLQKEILEK